ncbi:AAA family ATPase [Campylobacter sputorum]|uniref:AAA family ATPase n=1 Tax=Campylobacter sputorum TaxID=206 RepID=UPI00068F5011|nr:AAA family ATPase [Campylobacter sputorum]
MDILDMFYQNPPKISKFYDRKISIGSDKFILKGAINSGKTTLLKEWLLRNGNDDEILYVNFDDIRCDEKYIKENLSNFILTHKRLKAIALDGVNSDFDLDFVNLKVGCATKNNELKFENYDEIYVNNLDFEEFMVFYKKKFDIRTMFSSFINYGNGAGSVFCDINDMTIFLQNILKSNLDKTQIEILKQCCELTNKTFSANSIYKFLKKGMKISKDRVYETIFKFENEKYINLLPKINQTNGAKKIYMSDFAIISALNVNKNFQIIFSNIVYCELLKLKKEFFYENDIDFFIPDLNLGILCIPFRPSDLIFLKFKKLINKLKYLNIIKLIVISMSNQGLLEIEGIKCEIMPFWQFSASL